MAIPEDKRKAPMFGDKIRAILSFLIIGVALVYVLIIATGYITGWRTELESTTHLAAVGAFFSGIFGVILGYYFGRMGLTAAQKRLDSVQGVSSELARSVTQLQEVAQTTLKGKDERVNKLLKYADNALADLRLAQKK